MQREGIESLPHTMSQELIQDGSQLIVRARNVKVIENLEETGRKTSLLMIFDGLGF